jgi:hypothetical protein
LIEKIIEEVAVPDEEPVAVMVTVEVEVTVGVPDTTPVEVSRVSPVGRAPLEKVTVPFSPEVVSVEVAVIATPGVPVTVWEDGVTELAMFGAEVPGFGATAPNGTPLRVTEPRSSSIINTGELIVSLMLKTEKPNL